MMKKHLIYYTLLLAFLLPASSCSGWFDVFPKSDMTGEKLFDNEEGYYSALAGVYNAMASTSAYGGFLTIEQVEMLGNGLFGGMNTQAGNTEFFLGNYIPFYHFTHLSYVMFIMQFDTRDKSAELEKPILKMWTTTYNAIANANLLIEELEKTGDNMFPGAGVKNLLLGEALGLKACMHFDLLRLYQPPYKSGEGKTAAHIPYMERTTRDFVPSSTSSVILEKILADLERAAELMKEYDPVCSSRRYNVDIFASNRQYKMNYYAIKALQARVHLWRGEDGDFQAAYDAAMEVINAVQGGSAGSTGNTIRFVEESRDLQLTDSKNNYVNKGFPTENVFAMRFDNLSDRLYMLTHYTGFNAAYPGGMGLYQVQNILPAKIDYYWPGANDIRKKYWISTTIMTQSSIPATSRGLDKFWEPSVETADKALYPKQAMPIIRLAEVYLIAAEAAAELGRGDALTLLNTLQQRRNAVVWTDGSKNGIMDEILREYRRELIGEGQLFYAFKRRNAPAIEKSYTHNAANPDKHQMTAKKYTMDIPLDEYNNGRTYTPLQ